MELSVVLLRVCSPCLQKALDMALKMGKQKQENLNTLLQSQLFPVNPASYILSCFLWSFSKVFFWSKNYSLHKLTSLLPTSCKDI